VELNRKWRDGDAVTVQLPLSLRTEPLPGETSRVALLYGPIVLAGELGTSNLPSPFVRDQTAQVKLPTPAVPVFVSRAGALLQHVEPVAGQPLTFRTHGLCQPEEVTLIPFYRTHHQRYSVYWQLVSAQ
jgi:uncharacterized protein